MVDKEMDNAIETIRNNLYFLPDESGYTVSMVITIDADLAKELYGK